MGMTNVARLGGWSVAAFLGAAWGASCVDTAGSRTDVAGGDDSGVSGGADTGVSSGGSSSGGSSSGGSSSGSSGGGADTGPATPDSCGFPAPTTTPGVLYSGFPMGTGMGCVQNIPMPRNGAWFQYYDTTGDGGVAMYSKAEMGGCGGMSLCAYHAKGPTVGSGFLGYGAGVGFDLNDSAANVAMSYDAVAAGYTGIQFWAKGMISGTRGMGFSLLPQTIHLKLVTATNRGGDDYGFYCPMTDPTIWKVCTADFDQLQRDGWNSAISTKTDQFDGQNLLKVQFEFSRYDDTMTETNTVAFDVWIDEVSFYSTVPDADAPGGE